MFLSRRQFSRFCGAHRFCGRTDKEESHLSIRVLSDPTMRLAGAFSQGNSFAYRQMRLTSSFILPYSVPRRHPKNSSLRTFLANAADAQNSPRLRGVRLMINVYNHSRSGMPNELGEAAESPMRSSFTTPRRVPCPRALGCD